MGVDACDLGKPFERYGYAVSEAADTAHTAEARRVEREKRGHRMATAEETRAHVVAYKAKYPKARSLMSYNLNGTVGVDATADHLALLEMAKRRDIIYHTTTGQGPYRCEHFYFI
jgi:hypothetical protein